MAFPQKSRLRKITVDGAIYRYSILVGESCGALVVYGELSGGQRLVVESALWFDKWLLLPGPLPARPSETIKPAFVRAAILWALENGWNPCERRSELGVESGDGVFSEHSPNSKL